MGAQPNGITIQNVTIDELDYLIFWNARMYERYKYYDEFQEQNFREKIRYLQVKKEALLKKSARAKNSAKNESNEVR